jgi:hypothetical protein
MVEQTVDSTHPWKDMLFLEKIELSPIIDYLISNNMCQLITFNLLSQLIFNTKQTFIFYYQPWVILS